MRKIKNSLKHFLIDIQIKRVRGKYRRKIENVNPSHLKKDIPERIVSEFCQRWKFPKVKKVNPNYLCWYSKYSGKISSDFVPEDLYYTLVEPILNSKDINRAYSDKNFYDVFYEDGLFPKTVLRCIDNIFMDSSYKKFNLQEFNSLDADQLIIKPSLDSSGGKNVELFTKETTGTFRNGSKLPLDLNYIKKYNGNFIIQEIIKQHPFFRQFNKSSVNTIRAYTYRSVVTNEVIILHMVLRVGKTGENVDNSRAGGFSIGITGNGKLNNFALDKNCQKFEVINDVSLTNSEFHIPFFQNLKDLACKIASKNIHDHLLGLDLSIDEENGIKCLEVNNSGIEINFHQLNVGPLFGVYTDEIKNYCKRNQKKLYRSYVLK